MTTAPYKVADIQDMDGVACSCGSCGWKGSADDVDDIGECYLTPGDPSPVGRCPEDDCGSLCYIDRPLEDAASDLLAALTVLHDRCMALCKDRDPSNMSHEWRQIWHALAPARAAIAKATAE